MMTGKRRIPAELAQGISQKLLLSPEEQINFLDSLKSKIPNAERAFKLNEKEFETLFREWEYFVILGVLRLKGFQSSAKWISEKTEIPEDRVQECVQNLLNWGLIMLDESGRWVREYESFYSSHDVSSEHIRMAHIQNLDMSKMFLNSTPVEKRDFTFSSIALDKKGYGKLKKLILKLRNELLSLDESSEPETLYRVSVQCFPLTKE